MTARPPPRSAVVALLVLAPLVAEVLPGATRFSAMFVFPIEVAVWGGGALLVRAAARRYGLGWPGLVALAVALAVLEEFVVQQTSLAPLVIRLRGVEWARAGGVNYVYALWALVYETTFVVVVPVALVELAHPAHRDQPWIGRRGAALTGGALVVGAALAWYTWTRIARPRVFHLPAYAPPAGALVSGLVAIGLLAAFAAGPARRLADRVRPAAPPGRWALGALGAVWAVALHALAVLAFGIAPDLSPAVGVAAGLLLAAAPVYVVPRWAASAAFGPAERFSLLSGCILGASAAGFVGFIGAPWADLAFKSAVDALAVVLLLRFGHRLRAALPGLPGRRAA